MQKPITQNDIASQAVGLYAQALRSDQISLFPKDKRMIFDGVAKQIKQLLQNLDSGLARSEMPVIALLEGAQVEIKDIMVL